MRREPQPVAAQGHPQRAAGLQSLCGVLPIPHAQPSCRQLQGSASKSTRLWLVRHSGPWMGPTLCLSSHSVCIYAAPSPGLQEWEAFTFLRPLNSYQPNPHPGPRSYAAPMERAANTDLWTQGRRGHVDTWAVAADSAPCHPCRHRTRLTVSSLHIEWIWVPNMTAVKVKNRRPSRHRKTNRITVMGGEKSLHSADESEVLCTGERWGSCTSFLEGMRSSCVSPLERSKKLAHGPVCLARSLAILASHNLTSPQVSDCTGDSSQGFTNARQTPPPPTEYPQPSFYLDRASPSCPASLELESPASATRTAGHGSPNMQLFLKDPPVSTLCGYRGHSTLEVL